MNNYFANISLLKYFFKWKIHIIIIGILATGVSVIFSSPFFITPLYKSIAVVYPVNLMQYSEESETEQMQQILQSIDIRNRIYDDFNMAEHYGIDTAYEHYYSTLNAEFSECVKFKRTQFESIEIEVTDRNPQIASDITDSIISYYNDKVASLHKKKIKELLSDKMLILNRIQKEIDSLEQIHAYLRKKYKLLDYQLQTERLTEGYVKLLQSGNQQGKATNEIRGLITNLQEKGGEFISITSRLDNAHLIYNKTKSEYEIVLQEYRKHITYSQIISSPYPADQKSYPIRWIIVICSVFAAIILAIAVIAIIENSHLIFSK